MKSQTFKSEEEWLEARRGKITGSKLGSLLSKKDKKPLKGYYELIAERVAIPHDGESYLDRGHRLEDEAVNRFATIAKKRVKRELVMWSRDDNDNIAISPDGTIGKTEAVEVKCLSSANHIEAWLTKEIPSEYEYQVLQYFIVNDKLKKLYFIFYDPRMPKDLFWIEVNRSEVQEKVDEYLALEKEVLEQIEDIESELTFR